MGTALDRRAASDFRSKEVKEAVGRYVAEALGIDPDNPTREQDLQVLEQLEMLGFGQ
jgi:hypothetical protein